MVPLACVEDGPPGARIDGILQRRDAAFEGGHGADELERGARLHAVGDGVVAAGGFREGGGAVGVVGRRVGQRQHGARVRIDGERSAPRGAALLDAARQFLLQNRLPDQVEGQHQRLAVLRLDDGATDDDLEHAAPVTLHRASPRHAAQEGVVLQLEAGQPPPVGIDVAEDVGRRGVVVVATRKPRIE